MKLPKHHYIPVFYLREWVDSKNRLMEFSRPTGKDVKARDTAPTGTGYVRGLYRMNHLTGEAAEAFERYFFSMVDNLAKDGLDILMSRKPPSWTNRARSAWSRFVVGLLFRNPERIAATRKYIEDFTLANYEADKLAYEAQKVEDDPDYLEYIVRNVTFSTIDWTKGMLENTKIGQHLNNMYWGVRDVSDSGLKLFTSDRPVVMTNGLAYDWSNLVMPISPTKAFMACNTVQRMNDLKVMRSTEFVSLCNTKVLRYAQKYAWNTTDDQINSANRHLAAEAEVSRSFFDAPPLRSTATAAENE